MPALEDYISCGKLVYPKIGGGGLPRDLRYGTTTTMRDGGKPWYPLPDGRCLNDEAGHVMPRKWCE